MEPGRWRPVRGSFRPSILIQIRMISVSVFSVSRASQSRPWWPPLGAGTAAGSFLLILVAFCSGSIFEIAPNLHAAIIGTNPPAQSLTLDRIAQLPAKEQQPWKEYLDRSAKQLQIDQQILQQEMAEHHLKQSVVAPSGSNRSIPLNRPAAWYGSAEAQHIADIVVSYQTPAGGWSKNMNFSAHLRAPGEAFSPNNASRFSGK